MKFRFHVSNPIPAHVVAKCRRHPPQRRFTPGAVVAVHSDTCTIRMSVDTGSVTTLRRVAMRVCGEALEFIRIAAMAGGTRMQVWLCVRLDFAARLCRVMLDQLPGVQILPSLARGEAMR